MGNPLVLSAFDRVSEEIHSKNHPHPQKDLRVGLGELLETRITDLRIETNGCGLSTSPFLPPVAYRRRVEFFEMTAFDCKGWLGVISLLAQVRVRAAVRLVDPGQ